MNFITLVMHDKMHEVFQFVIQFISHDYDKQEKENN